MMTLATTRLETRPERRFSPGFATVPLVLLVTAAAALGRTLPPWAFMWVICVAMFAGLKWLTWWRARGRVPHSAWRSVAYLLASPGMDAERFLADRRADPAVAWRDWLDALFRSAAGAVLIWVVARRVPASRELLRGWVGMVGLILLLHFGVFHLVALFWERMGVDTLPIMDHPLRSASLGEFWGSRWNMGFREFAHDLIFRPLQPMVGPRTAGFLVFLASGLIHELAISLPARGGYGLPALYFALQGLGVAAERSRLGKRLGLRRGWQGRVFTFAITAGPVVLLFHPWFVERVMVPFLAEVGA